MCIDTLNAPFIEVKIKVLYAFAFASLKEGYAIEIYFVTSRLRHFDISVCFLYICYGQTLGLI